MTRIIAQLTSDTKRLDGLLARIAPQLEAVIAKGGFDIEKSAKRIITEKDIIDTGATLNETASRPVDGQKLARRIGTTTEYAPFLELGTRNMAARPFMTPALEENRSPILSAIAAVMKV